MLFRKHFGLLLLIIALTTSCQKKSEDCIYLLPKGFEGNVVIVFNQDDGIAKSYENGMRVFRIDSTGILKTSFEVDNRAHRCYFYELKDENSRDSLRYLLPSHFSIVPATSPEIFVTNLVPVVDYDAKASKDRHSELFTVSKIKNLDSIGNLSSAFMWKAFDNKGQ